jgi:hypothetical protein
MLKIKANTDTQRGLCFSQSAGVEAGRTSSPKDIELPVAGGWWKGLWLSRPTVAMLSRVPEGSHRAPALPFTADEQFLHLGNGNNVAHFQGSCGSAHGRCPTHNISLFL